MKSKVMHLARGFLQPTWCDTRYRDNIRVTFDEKEPVTCKRCIQCRDAFIKRTNMLLKRMDQGK